MVALHGCTQTGEGYAEGAGWLTLADRYGFAVLAPEQGRANNPNLCFNWFQRADTTRGSGEVASIAQMIRFLVACESLDASRVFITGLSAGGAMSAAMLAAYPEMFEAGAIIAGLPHGSAETMQEAFAAMAQTPDHAASVWGDRVRNASSHQGPWPRIAIWHGDADTTVRPGAGDALARQWTNVHGLDAAAGEINVSGRRRTTHWRTSDGARLVEHYVIAGMGQARPLKSPVRMVAAPKRPTFSMSASRQARRRFAFWGSRSGESCAHHLRRARTGSIRLAAPGAGEKQFAAAARHGRRHHRRAPQRGACQIGRRGAGRGRS